MRDSFENLKGLLTGHVPGRESCPEFRVDAEHALVYVRLAGKLTAKDIQRYADALRKDPLFEPGRSEIVDLRAVEEFEISADEAIRLADQVDAFSLSSRRAFVVKNDFQRHAARMQQILRSPFKTIGIFDAMAEAEAWVRTATHQAPAQGAQVLSFPSRFRS
jgi:hypothetical protein